MKEKLYNVLGLLALIFFAIGAIALILFLDSLRFVVNL